VKWRAFIAALGGAAACFASSAGAEQINPTTFQIQLSQPEYQRAGKTWICSSTQLLQNKCREAVPIIMFGEPRLAIVDVSLTRAGSLGTLLVLRASLDGYPVKYKAAFIKGRPMALGSDGSFAGEIRFDQADERLAVARRTPGESFGLIIKPKLSETNRNK
jgi:hypothetical protein